MYVIFLWLLKVDNKRRERDGGGTEEDTRLRKEEKVPVAQLYLT